MTERILLVHPGHGHSSKDVFDGLHAGLIWAGAEVVTFEWDRMLQPLTAVTLGAIAAGIIKEEKGEALFNFMSWLASGDVTNVVIDAEVNAVVVVNGLLFPPSRARVLASIGIPVACYGTEAPYFESWEQQFARFYTHFFTQERTAVKRFQEHQPRTFYLPMAYNPETHQPMEKDPDRACDLVFVGGGFPERKRTIAGVDWSGIDHRILGTLWGLDLDQEVGKTDFARGNRYTEGAIPNEEASAWHRSAKIALNMHRRMGTIEGGNSVAAGSAESLGPRAYEIPAVGGFLLSDDERPELRDVYGDSAATFKAWDSDDLERQVRYWLGHPDARERVQAAQHEAVKLHHWGMRAKTLLEHIID